MSYESDIPLEGESNKVVFRYYADACLPATGESTLPLSLFDRFYLVKLISKISSEREAPSVLTSDPSPDFGNALSELVGLLEGRPGFLDFKTATLETGGLTIREEQTVREIFGLYERCSLLNRIGEDIAANEKRLDEDDIPF